MKIHKSTSTTYSYSNKYGSRGIKYQQRRLTKLQAQSKVDNKVISNDEVDKVSEGQKIFNYALAYGIIFLMFFIVLNYASQIAMEIASEKTSRVIEMIITSISPIQHIFAKILGIIAVAVTQIILIVLMAVICILPLT